MLNRLVAGGALIAGAALGSGCAADPPAAVVAVIATGCPPTAAHGSGAVVADGLVLTSAHVVAGASTVEVERGAVRAPARVVGFDPDADLAYLAVDDWRGTGGASPTPLDLADERANAGDAAVAWVIRDGTPTRVTVTVARTVTIRTEDVYVDDETERPGIELDGDIRRGDSGGAIVVRGEVVGVVWARSTEEVGRAYATDVVVGRDRIDGQLDTGDVGTDVDLTRCP